MAHFIEVPADQLQDALRRAGFGIMGTDGEIVYERSHDVNKALRIRVYTSLSQGAASTRECGQDAIRATLVWWDASQRRAWAIAKSTRVHRTGTVDGVLTRMLDRARDLYVIANQIVRAAKKCGACGAPGYPDSGRCIRAYDHQKLGVV